MDVLPMELCDHICHYLDFADLKTVRLSCMKYNIVGSKWLFREIVIYMNRESLAKVKQISQAPHLTSNIRTLSVYCDHCPKLTFGSFKATYRRLISLDIPEKELHRAHKHYQNLAQEGIQMQSDSSIRKALSMLFSKCTILASIHVTLASGTLAFTTNHASKQFQKGLVCPLGQPNESKFGIYVMEQVIQAAQDAQSSFERLYLINISQTIMGWCAGTLPLVFNNLTDLSWSFPQVNLVIYFEGDPDIPDHDDEDDDGPSIDEDLGQRARYANLKLYETLIIHLNKLRSLNLEFTSIPWAPRAMPELRVIVRNHVFPNLRNLRLRGLQSTSADILDFLLRHADSLRFIQIEAITLTEGTWSSLLQALKGKLPKLVKFELRGELKDGSNKQSKFWRSPEVFEDLVQHLSNYIRLDVVDWPLNLDAAGIDSPEVSSLEDSIDD